jgi:hypothetical protein
MLSIRAIFDGKVFVPEEPLSLPRDARYTLVLTKQARRSVRPKQVTQATGTRPLDDFLAKGPVAGAWPKDFASEVDHYVYALPKHATKRSAQRSGMRSGKQVSKQTDTRSRSRALAKTVKARTPARASAKPRTRAG